MSCFGETNGEEIFFGTHSLNYTLLLEYKCHYKSFSGRRGCNQQFSYTSVYASFHTISRAGEYPQLQVLSTETDKWTYPQRSTNFSSIQMYKTPRQNVPAHYIFTCLQKSAAILRHIIFFWLLLHDRVNSINYSRERNFICHFTTVNFALKIQWRHLCICFGVVVLHWLVGTQYLSIETDAFLCWMTYLTMSSLHANFL